MGIRYYASLPCDCDAYFLPHSFPFPYISVISLYRRAMRGAVPETRHKLIEGVIPQPDQNNTNTA